MKTTNELEQLRFEKREIEKYLPEIEQKKEICNQLTENIQYERQKLQSIHREIKFRSNRLSELASQYRAITDKGAVGSKHLINDIKTQIIKEKICDLLIQKIPEAGININKKSKNDLKENEFQNLIHSKINIIYTKYESSESKVKADEEMQLFCICTNTKFSTLKETACQYWRLNNVNDYLLTDDSEAIIYNEEDLVNNYMKGYSARSNKIRLMSSALLKSRIKVMPLQETRIQEENVFKSKLKFEVKKRNNGINVEKGNEFIVAYSLLNPFYRIKREVALRDKDENEIKPEAKEIETSFLMLLLAIVLFILTIVFIYKPNRNIGLNLNKKDYFTNLFTSSTIMNYKDLYDFIIFQYGINNFPMKKNNFDSKRDCDEDLIKVLKEINERYETNPLFTIVANSAFCENNDRFDSLTYLSQVNQKNQEERLYTITSSIHMILSRIKLGECSSSDKVKSLLTNTQKCYENRYSKSNKNTEALTPKTDFNEKNLPLVMNIYEQMTNFKKASDAKIHLSVSTPAGDFDGSGYHIDLPTNNQYDFVDYIHAFSKFIPLHKEFYSTDLNSSPKDKIDYYNLINTDVRSLIFLFNAYFPNEDIFCNVMLLVNFFSSGGIQIEKMEVRPFEPSIYSKGYIAIDIVRLIIIIILIILVIGDYFYSKRPLLTYITISSVSNIIILGLFLAIFIIKLSYCNESKESFFNDVGIAYKDGYRLAIMFESALYLECILLIFVTIKLITLLKLWNYMRIIFTVIDKSIAMFTQYLIVILVMFFGFAMIAEIVWGPYISQFETFGASFLSILLFTCGYYDTNLMVEYNPVWAFFFISFYFIFILFLLFTIFNAIFAESLRRSTVAKGYPEDDEIEEWAMKDYMYWVIPFLKENKVKKIKV